MPMASGLSTGNFRPLLSISCVVSNMTGRGPEITAVMSNTRARHYGGKSREKLGASIINPASKGLREVNYLEKGNQVAKWGLTFREM